MNHLSTPEFGFAKDAQLHYRSGYSASAVTPAGEALPATVLSEHFTVGELANAGSRDVTHFNLVVTPAQVAYLQTGEYQDAVELKGPSDIQYGTRRSQLGMYVARSGRHKLGTAWDDQTADLRLAGGAPAHFTRMTSSWEQFKCDMAKWPAAVPRMERGIDFTDALLGLLATGSSVQLPAELRPSRFTPRTTRAREAEAEKQAGIRAFLRERFLNKTFGENAQKVSIIAAF